MIFNSYVKLPEGIASVLHSHQLMASKALSKAATAFVANLTVIADAHLEKLVSSATAKNEPLQIP